MEPSRSIILHHAGQLMICARPGKRQPNVLPCGVARFGQLVHQLSATAKRRTDFDRFRKFRGV